MRKIKRRRKNKNKDRALSFRAIDVYDDEIGNIPQDITTLSHEQLRAAHSYWVACHNSAEATLARARQHFKELKREREVIFKTLFVANKQHNRQSNEMARYNAELDFNVLRLDDAITKIDVFQIRCESLVLQCDHNRVLLSREQSWREKERDVYYTKGGRGK